MLQWQAYALFPLSGTVISAVAACLAWHRRRSTPAAMALLVVMSGLVLWAGTDAIGSLSTDLTTRTNLALARFPGTSAAALGFCRLCRTLSDRTCTTTP
ncbi:hypothetical protein Q0Z83_049140 [Actinoplanes sichuanensis]|uniref:Histidine kinase N-terminal 7TM region domain-containing protein n=1 Tax=Actinoplanes sichuanensis TaxID=512349 RepID=A0ABW4APT8_9ACTN|nr:hypothetical protein [Actinoplanes sichuanensis]BEL06723.1 hypothetical protein Q0Z83_049140 [Actinoplanes sichuanensis]